MGMTLISPKDPISKHHHIGIQILIINLGMGDTNIQSTADLGKAF